MKASLRRALASHDWLIAAVVSAVLLGLAFPPTNLAWLAWIGLTPLLWIAQRQEQALKLLAAGIVCGTLYFLIVNRPLTSAHLWGGWLSASSAEEQSGLLTNQLIVLNILWVILSIWCGLFWGLFTLLLAKLSQGRAVRFAILAPCLFILLPEWLRSETLWDYQWGMLGNSLIGFGNLRQLGAFGGIWLLSGIVVVANVAALFVLQRPVRNRYWPALLAIGALLIVAISVGHEYRQQIANESSSDDGIRVGGIQYSQDDYSLSDYTSIGLEKNYLTLIQQITRGDIGPVDLLVLPESIAFGVFSLDGTTTHRRPMEVQKPIDRWTDVLTTLLNESRFDLTIVMGLETVENQQPHNSMIFWNRAGLQDWYHKERLVPFAEYPPRGLQLLGMSGESGYAAGRSSRLVSTNDVQIGSFICQEVQIPETFREELLQGAQLLTTGGNDGVFADPAVAETHAQMARLRAVESGRYIVRAMKTGVSAVISPTGEEISRSPGQAPFVVVGTVHPRSDTTLYTQLGDWPVWLAFLVTLIAIALQARARRAHAS